MNTRTSTIVLGALVLILALVIVFLLARGNGSTSQTATSTSATSSVEVNTANSPIVNATTTITTTTKTTAAATYHNATSAQIAVSAPKPGAALSGTISVSGQAVGPWYSEAVFPVKLLDKNGTVIATGQAHAQGDWMTTSLVPFTAQITVPQGYTGSATLVLAKDNPSGLASHDASVTIPVTIK